jgi:hypothetical protein
LFVDVCGCVMHKLASELHWRVWGISQEQRDSKMLGYAQGHNTTEKATSIPFGLPPPPKTPNISGTHTPTKKPHIIRPNGTPESQEQEVTKKRRCPQEQALAGFGVSRKGRRYRKSGVSRKGRHWRGRGSVWPVISSVSREGGGCRKCGLLLARAGWPNGMEVG